MSLSRCLSSRIFKLFAAAMLLAVGAQPAVPQTRSQSAQSSRVGGAQALRGQEILFTSPQFKVEALWFKANDETNWAWQGSDEVYAVFSDMDPTHSDRVTSIYGNVDEGDTVNFVAADRCMAPQPNCDRGTPELNVRFSFWEKDPPFDLGFSFCPGDFPGAHEWLQNGKCDVDDLIGRGAIIHSRDELLAMLPNVGATREATAVMDDDAGIYRFRYRITRLADVERNLVIHLPPDIGTTPTITLQATALTLPGQDSVRLTWTGATTNTVDIFRNATKVATTANDGTHDDPVPNGTYQYRLCNLNSTTACSATVTVTVG